MKKINDEKKNCQGTSQQKHVKKLVVMPLRPEIKDHAFESLKLGRQIFRKLQDVEELIETIAREIKRQSDRQT